MNKNFLSGFALGVILMLVTVLVIDRQHKNQLAQAHNAGRLEATHEIISKLTKEFPLYAGDAVLGEPPYKRIFSLKTTDVVVVEDSTGEKLLRIIP